LAESLALELSRKLGAFDLITELDLSGASFSKQFKKANKFNSKSVVVIGDKEALKKEFSIRLFIEDQDNNDEQTILLEDNVKLKEWICRNLKSTN